MKHLIQYLLVSFLLLNVFLIKAQTEYIVTVNPVNAAITKIDSIPGVIFIQSSSPAYNQTTKEYTFIGTLNPALAPSYLYTVDAISGSTISKPALTAPTTLNSFQYSRSTGILYGIIYQGGLFYLATIDKTSGNYSIIQNISGIDGITGFTIDEANQRLFVRAVDNNPGFAIWTIDLTTGNIIYHAPTKNVNYLHYDNVSHTLYGVISREGPTPGSYILSTCTVDPVTGIVTNIADLPGASSTLSGDHAAFDENDHLYFFTATEYTSPGAIFLYTVDVTTGNIINRAQVPSSGAIDHDNLVFFRYDNISGKLYALYWEAHTGSVLPITLGKFDAVLKEKTVVCNWQTFQEINSDHFVIERSNDAIKFTAIGTVAAAGNSSTLLNYNFIDKDPFSTGSNYLYYRLKMADRDANFSYSNIATLKLNYESSLSISPNPVRNQLFFDYYSSTGEEATLLINDAIGKLIYKQNVLIKKGTNSFSIDVSLLAAGVYILSVKGQSKYSKKFIKASD